MRRLQQNSQSQPYNTALLPTRCSGQTPLIHQGVSGPASVVSTVLCSVAAPGQSWPSGMQPH